MITQLDGPYVLLQGKKMLDFSSQDFLGLAQHPEVKKSAVKYVLRYGVGPSPALQQEIEQKLARYLGKKEAALYPTLEAIKDGTDFTDEFGLVEPKIKDPVVYGSLEKAGGCPLSFVASMHPIKHRTDTISAALLGALDAILNLLPDMEDERNELARRKKWLEKALSDAGLKNPLSAKTRTALAEAGIYVADRMYVTALHTPDDLDQLTQALKKLDATDAALATQSLSDTP